MRKLGTFFDLSQASVYRICNFLDRQDMRSFSAVNKELKQTITQQQIFYVPVYESIKGRRFKSPLTWNYINSSFTLKKFYLSKENLFKENPDAPGCYKISMSWLEIIQREPRIQIDVECKKYFRLPLSFSEKDIESYIKRQSYVEHKNPFYQVKKPTLFRENEHENQNTVSRTY